MRKGIEHYRYNCQLKEGLRKDQKVRAKAFEGDIYEERIKDMTEEEKRNEVDFNEYEKFYDKEYKEKFSYDY